MNFIHFEGFDEFDEITPKKEGDVISDNGVKYKLKKFIGQGRFGTVFNTKTSIGRNVAIKIIEKDLLFDDDFNQESIQNEINVHLSLKNNRILNFEKMFQDKENIYMVLELCEMSLYNSIYNLNEFFSENDIIKIIFEITEGLMFLKENLIIHRDIKAENILINKDGFIKIADFGGCEKLKNIYETSIEVQGTQFYISYQMAKGEEYSFETDVWSFGILIYEVVFKKLLFEGKTLKDNCELIINNKIEFPENSRFNSLIEMMLEKDRLKRISLKNIIHFFDEN